MTIKTLEELKRVRDQYKDRVGIQDAGSNLTRVVVGMATCGISSGARPILNKMSEMVKEKGLSNVEVVQTGCIGLCQYEPIVEVMAPGQGKVTYIRMTPEKAAEVVEQHLVKGEPVAAYTLNDVDL